MRIDQIHFLSNDEMVPELQKLLNMMDERPLVIIYQRYGPDFKTVKDYKIGTAYKGDVINIRTGKGDPVLLENEIEYPVFCMSSMPYNPSAN